MLTRETERDGLEEETLSARTNYVGVNVGEEEERTYETWLVKHKLKKKGKQKNNKVCGEYTYISAFICTISLIYQYC